MDNLNSNRPIDKTGGGGHADDLCHLPVEAFGQANTQDPFFKKSLSIFGRSAEKDEIRGPIQEGNRDAPMINQRNGKWGTFIEKPANFLPGIRSSVRNDPPRGSKKRERKVNRLSQWSHRSQGDQVVSVAMLRIIHKLLSAGVKDGEMRTGDLSGHLSEKQRPLTPRFQESDVQIWAEDLNRDAGKTCSGTDVEKGECLVGRNPGQRGKRVEHVPGHQARKIVRSHEIDAPTPHTNGVEMKKQVAKVRIGHGEAKRPASVSNR